MAASKTGRNERLRRAMDLHGLGFADLAAVTGVNLKTTQRWVYENRTPRTAARQRIAELLDDDETWLWPGLKPEVWTPDLVRVFPQWESVPSRLWHQLARKACSRIDVGGCKLVNVASLVSVVAARARVGVDVRVCSADPAWRLTPRARVRAASTSFSLSILRCDLAMLVWLPCAAPNLKHLGPVLQLARAEDNGMFDTYAYIFDTLWHAAAPEG